MYPTRRDLLKSTLAMAAMAGLGTGNAAATKREALDILILGGTGFLGPHTVRAALARGHRMTLFNRGRTNPHLFQDLEKLVGDRDGKLDALKGRRWDAVIDTSGYVPRLVDASATLLADACDHYLFVSTVSVYRDFATPGMDEDTPVGTLDDPTVETVDGETYGPLKALCEQAAERAMPGRTTVVRPGLIVGPGDPTDRFTYWPVRIADGGEVLAPGTPSASLQIMDARDLAAWMILCLEQRTVGTYNAMSPPGLHTMGALMNACRSASDSDAEFTWIDADFLEANGVAPWSDLPAWIPPRGDYAGFGAISVDRATDTGLTHRDLKTTCADTLDWWRDQAPERRKSPKAGLDRAREREVLAAWHRTQADS